jgi:hypothetical protein
VNEHVKSVEQAAESHSPNVKPEILSIAYHAASATDIISDPFADGEPPHTTNRILNLRRIQSWENYFLASAICSVAVATGAEEETLRTLGREKVNSGFHFFSALTGDMFTVLYATNKPCDSGVTNYFFWPQVVKKAYVAFGYDCLYLSNAQIKKDFRAAMNAIKASVDKGIPVLAWGMGNVTMSDGSRYDPLPEACLIGGYDEDDVLYVNLYPGPERMTVDGDGYTAITHGLNTTKGLFFVGGPVEPPHLRRVYSNTIKSIPVFLAMPSSDGYVFGKAALEKWADTLLDEGRFAGKTDEELGGICWDLHCSPYCCVDTSTAEPYIRAAAEVYEIGLAKKLLPLYQRFTHLGQEIGSLHGGFFPPMTKFRTRAFRAQIAEKLQKMGETCNDILHAFEDE